MASHNNFSPQLDLPSTSLRADPVDVIWQMGLASLASNNNGLVLPLHMGDTLSDSDVLELKRRLSFLFNGAPSFAYKDFKSHVFRICLVESIPATRTPSPAYASPPVTTTSPESTASHEEPLPNHVLRSPGKKSKVRRPPNAFILYRKKYHPILKKQQPNLHNNDISVILGKQWKAEAESVKAEYKSLAEKIKKQHAFDNPGYQYAPRKPAEKKRRMTARKLARIQASEREEGSQNFPGIEMLEVADHGRSESEGAIFMDDSSDEDIYNASEDSLGSAAALLGVELPRNAGSIRMQGTGTLAVTLPTSPNNVEEQLNNYPARVNPTHAVPFSAMNRTEFESLTPQQVMNDADFLNSLIDWDAIKTDVNYIRASVGEDMAELDAIELGDPSLLLSDEASRLEFQAELERTLQMFE